MQSRLLFLLTLAGTLTVHAQFDQGQIAGTVKDSSDAVIGGANITVSDRQSGLRLTAITGPGGSYTVTGIPAGVYDLAIEAKGFKKYVSSNVRVDAAARTTLDAVLDVGATSDTVTVEAKATLLERETAQIGRTVESQQITDLALNGRNPIKLAVLKAGVIGAENFNDFAPAQLHEQFSINGGRRAGNNVMIDGVNANRTRGDFNGTAELGLLNADAVQEVQILTSTYPAEFGHTMDGQIIFVSKAGARDFHGSAYEFFRNSKLDANSWIRNQSPNLSDNSRPAPFRFNEPGYSIGGPVFIPGKFNSNRSKLFFFGSQEWIVFRQDKTDTGIVPSVAMRHGDFSELLLPSNPFFKKTRVVNNPDTGAPFPNNVIPASMLSPNGVGILNSYPLPTAGFQQGTSNWIETLAHPIDSRRDSVRFDYYLSDKQRINFSGTHFTYSELDPFAPTGGLDRSVSGWDRPNQTSSIGVSSTLSATKVNQFTVSAAEDVVRLFLFKNGIGANGEPWTREQYGINYPYILGQQLRVPNRIPQAAITGFTTVDGSARPESSSGPIYSLQDSFTWIRNSHTLKFGFLLEEAQANNNDQTGVQNGTFTFLDSGNPRTSGVAVANAAMGLFNNDIERGQAAYTLLRSLAFESYAQDTWKVTQHLTLEMGVRYSWFQPWHALWNDISNFDMRFYDPSKAAVIDPTGGFIVSGSPFNGIVLPGNSIPSSSAGRAYAASVPGVNALFHNLPPGLVNSYHNAFAPRLGIAYQLGGKTIVRAGGGVFHQRQMLNQNALVSNAPNQFQITVVNGLVDNPGGGATHTYPFDFNAINRDAKYPTAYSYSLSLQRELPGSLVLDVSYVGKTAVNQERINAINALPQGTVQQHPTIAQAALRPYVGLGNIYLTSRDGRTNYNSLQVTVDKRFSSGLGMGMAYTFSKNLANLMNNISPMRPYNPGHFVKAVDELDRPQVLNLNFIYDLPFFKTGNALERNTLGGWHLSGVYFARSGNPLSIVSGVDYAGVGVGTGPQPWNVVGDWHVTGDRGVGKPWFNASAFAQPAPGTFGNAGLAIIRGPHFQNLDLATFKDFRIRERLTAQFRLEVFDVPNHAFLVNPGVDPTSPATFGLITAKGGTGVAGSGSAASASQRNLQLALKFRF